MTAHQLREAIESGPPDGDELATIRPTISLLWLRLKFCWEAILEGGYSNLSDYFQGLIINDKERRDQKRLTARAIEVQLPPVQPKREHF